jgi:hypothetical protein
MFARVPLVLGSLLTAAALAAACEPPDTPFPPLREPLPPKGSVQTVAPFPQLGTVVALNGKEQTIEYTVVVPVLVREPIWRYREHPLGTGDGARWELVRKPGPAYHWQYRQITRSSKIDRLKFSTATGKQLTTDEVWKRLAIGTTFFVSADGAPVSAAHLKLIARDALVVVDFDNVVLERLVYGMEQPGLEEIAKPLPHPGPRPKPPVLPHPGPEPR